MHRFTRPAPLVHALWPCAAAILLTAASVGSALLLDASAWSPTRLGLAQTAVVGAAVAGLALMWLALRRAQRSTRQAQDMLALQREVLDTMQSAVVLWDRDDRLIFANKDFISVYSAMAAQLQPGVRFEDALRASIAAGLVPEAQADPEAWIGKRLALRHRPKGPMLRELPGDHWRLITEQRLSDGSLVGHSTDVSELVRREQALTALNQRLDQVNAELARLSETDALTGLGNRRLFDRRLPEECARAARHGTPLTLLLLDVDHFKRFNDRYGHPAGDVRLTQLARVLEQSARRPGDVLARVGGEEFALLLPHLDPQAAMDQAQRLQAALAEASPQHGQMHYGDALTVSIGVAVWQGPGGEDELAIRPAGLLAQADSALYEAKRLGRARTVLHSEVSG